MVLFISVFFFSGCDASWPLCSAVCIGSGNTSGVEKVGHLFFGHEVRGGN